MEGRTHAPLDLQELGDVLEHLVELPHLLLAALCPLLPLGRTLCERRRVAVKFQ